jgi:AbrB family looped-hinge helix DNA binding protein
MGIAQSKVTAQGQISIPARVRQKLGIGPGSMLEWDEKGGDIVVRRVGQYTSEDVHRAVFSQNSPSTKRLDELKEGIRKHMKRRYARH